jgi:NRPS condensation-like uncharacterized protein
MLNVNHAAFDGYGSLRLLQSIARAYTGAPDPAPAVGLHDARQVERHLTTDDTRARAERFRDVGNKLTDLFRPPARLEAADGEDEAGYGFHHVALSPEETRQLVEADGSVTVNDLLLAALTVAAERWNAVHGRACGRIGVLVPVNLRPKQWQTDVVTNLVLDTRVSTGPLDRRSRRQLLDALAHQTRRIKRWGTGAAVFEVLALSPRLPMSVKQPLSPVLAMTGDRLVDTALLSNLGSVAKLPSFGPEAGEATGLWFSAPTRMPGGLSVGAASAGGRLCLSFRYRRPLFGPTAARHFAELFLSELRVPPE